MQKSFAELQQSDSPNPQDVIDTLKDYAETGAVISGRVVIEVIGKSGLSREQLSDCLTHATKGNEVHVEMSQRPTMEPGKPDAEKREAGEFTQVAEHIRELLSEV